jgi:hypothetical protein
MSVFDKLNNKSLLLLLNQIRQDFIDEDLDLLSTSDFFENSSIIETKCSYFGIDVVKRTDMTYLMALFMDVDEDLSEEITELPNRPKLNKVQVRWKEVAHETNEYIYQTNIDSYCPLDPYDLEIMRNEDWFDPWGGKIVDKTNFDWETTEDECESSNTLY